MSFFAGLIPMLSGIASPGLGTALQIGGLATSALGSIASAQQQAAAMKANAQMAEYQAKLQLEAGKQESSKISRARNQMIGTQSALYGASGVTNTGSPLQVMADTAAEYERDIQMAGYGAHAKAASSLYEADVLRSMAGRTKTAGWFGAGSTILTGLGKNLLY